jgi:hypothetical protein
MIPNPDYYKVENVLDLMAPVAGVAFELWTTDTGYTFDGVLVGQGEQGLDAAKTYLNKIWRPRHKAEVSTWSAGLWYDRRQRQPLISKL